MKATLTFEDEEREMLLDAINGPERKSQLIAIYDAVYDMRKHGTHLIKDEVLDNIWQLLPNDLHD